MLNDNGCDVHSRFIFVHDSCCNFVDEHCDDCAGVPNWTASGDDDDGDEVSETQSSPS